MSVTKDFSATLVRINELLKANGPLDSVDSPELSEELREALGAVQGKLLPDMQLKPIEVLVIAKTFVIQPQCHARSGHILKDLCAPSVGIREQLRVLQRMREKGILEAICTIIKIKDWERPKLEYQYSLAQLYDEPLMLSFDVLANIIGDEESLRSDSKQGFMNNLEFLESWGYIVEAMDMKKNSLRLCEGNEGSDLIQVYRIREQYDLIQARLDNTKEEIPFRTLCSDFELTYLEQLVIMYGVYHYHDERSVSDLRNSAALLPPGSPSFMWADVLDTNSKLVDKKIFRPFRRDPDGKSEYKYRLATLFYTIILGDLSLQLGRPMLP